MLVEVISIVILLTIKNQTREIMKVAILGASGFIGKAVVKYALDSGHELKVLVRTPTKLGPLKDKVKVIQGDLEDKESIELVIQGCDAVISTAGGAKEPDQYQKFANGTKILLAAMKKENIKTLISINGAAMILPNEKASFKQKVMNMLIGLLAKHMLAAKKGEFDVLIKETEVDWVSVRATQIKENKATGHVLTNDQKMPGGSIILADLAKFMVDQAISTEWAHKAPMVASQK